MAAVPTVHEFLNSYRMIYDQIRGYGREETNRAYEKLLDVENRTDDLVEAQYIIEKEHLVLNTVIADYKAVADEFLEAADPGYDVTSAVTQATVGVYATAKSLDEGTYMGEVAKGRTSDLAVQINLKVQLMTAFTGLVHVWEHSKRKIREGDMLLEDYVRSMVVTRKKIKEYYRFLSEDMGLTFDVMEQTPFFRISMLNPSGLDELWRLKKVMHPDNIQAIKYVLFEEVLTDKTIEEILLTPQKYPYYESLDTLKYPEVTDEFQQIADEMNKDIAFFKHNRAEGRSETASGLAEKMGSMNRKLMKIPGQGPQVSSAVKSQKVPGISKGAGGGIAKDIAKSAAKDIGKGLLKGLFRR